MPPCALQLAACGSAVCLCAAASVASLVCIRHGGEPQATLESLYHPHSIRSRLPLLTHNCLHRMSHTSRSSTACPTRQEHLQEQHKPRTSPALQRHQRAKCMADCRTRRVLPSSYPSNIPLRPAKHCRGFRSLSRHMFRMKRNSKIDQTDQKSRPWLHTCWRALAPCMPAHLLYFQSGKAVTRTPRRPSRDYQGNSLVRRNSL